MERYTAAGTSMLSVYTGRALVAGMAILALLAGGCPGTTGSTITDYTDGNVDDTLTSPIGKTAGEPNDTFASAIVAVFAGDEANLKGTVSEEGDIDVFRLPALEPGDRIVVDTATPDSSLDVSIAIFDSAQRLVSENDDYDELDSYISFIVRHEGDPYYLVVSHSAFAGGNDTGTYTVALDLSSGLDVPAPVPQTLVLDFDGATLSDPIFQVTTLEPFDSGDISRRYEGETELFKELIRAEVEQNFERFDVTVLTTDDPLPSDPTTYSTLYFGGFRDDAFGIAQQVDLYNVDYCDDALIYTESFVPSYFGIIPTTEQMALAIGNVAAHEAGHILGLNHVDDELDLMDGASPADTLLFDQEFKESVLSSDIIPIGMQDGVLLLTESIGAK